MLKSKLIDLIQSLRGNGNQVDHITVSQVAYNILLDEISLDRSGSESTPRLKEFMGYPIMLDRRIQVPVAVVYFNNDHTVGFQARTVMP